MARKLLPGTEKGLGSSRTVFWDSSSIGNGSWILGKTHFKQLRSASRF